MENIYPQNLIEVDSLIECFLKKHALGIQTIHRVHFHNDNSLSIRALIAELLDELKTGCVTFLNKGSPIEELNSYLFYIVNAYCKKKSVTSKKKIDYLCPGCLFLGKESLISIENRNFHCNNCEIEFKLAKDPKKIHFYKTFYKHSKNGYHCQDCKRFIPCPIDKSSIISCPYYDCCFVGSLASLKKMHHPNSQSKLEILSLDSVNKNGSSFKDMISSNEINIQSKLEIKEDLDEKLKIIKSIIDSQSNSIAYTSSDFTLKHKYLVYQAFGNIIKKFPTEIVDYLFNNSLTRYGFQHLIFQEYINLLEESLPFSFKKSGKIYRVDSLLDPNLNIFDGISVFDAVISDKLEIKNGTKEFYIGGRKGYISKPYYIGKLLSINDKKTKIPLLENVINYSFSKIKMRDINPGTEVIISHLRVPPHYQMGGMVYINRIRKKIVDRIQSTNR